MNTVSIKISKKKKGNPKIHLEEQKDLKSWDGCEKDDLGACLPESWLPEDIRAKTVWNWLKNDKYINRTGQRAQKQATVYVKTWYMTEAHYNQCWVIMDNPALIIKVI